MKKISLLLWGVLFLTYTHAQKKLQWFEPQWVEGICKPDTAHIYHRLPTALEAQVRPIVWRLSLNTAGEYLHFRTTARSITVKYTLAGRRMELPHMPATGVSGLDLYAVDRDGKWNWAPPRYKFGDTCVYEYKNMGLAANKPMADFYLYLPLYNTVEWLSIGIADSLPFEYVPERRGKPVVAYGTSIMQGAVASRPGMAWTNMLSRNIDREIMNLGFSGNGKYEKPLFDLMAKVDAALYILDCMPNLYHITEESLYDSLKYGIGKLQAAHPRVPILLAEHADGYMPMSMDTALVNTYHEAGKTARAVFNRLQAEGIKNLYLLTDEEIGFDINSTVEGTHPGDIGMMKYAEAYEKKIREILHEPRGTSATQIPVEQYRDGYNWLLRHEQVMQHTGAMKAKVLLLGNSIVNYWGGEPVPENGIARSNDACQRYMAPGRVQNAGFGNDRIENVLWRIYHGEVDQFEGDQIILMIGTNNLAHNTDEEIVNGLSFLVQQIQYRQPRAQVIVAGLLPRKNREIRIGLINELIRQKAVTGHYRFVDFFPAFMKGEQINEGLFLPDGLHPNAAGYAALGKALELLF